LSARAKQSEQLREAQFAGEAPRQTEIRHRLESTRAPSEEATALTQEYRSIHYELGQMTFEPILMFEDVSGQFRIYSKDNGKTWEVQELQAGSWVRGSKYIIKGTDGKPIRLTQQRARCN
jgi:hypothetical protein